MTKGGPCYTFLKLNRKTYHMEFGFKMLTYANDTILKGVGYDVNVFCNKWNR